MHDNRQMTHSVIVADMCLHCDFVVAQFTIYACLSLYYYCIFSISELFRWVSNFRLDANKL